MAAGHLVQRSLHGVVAVRVKDGHHPVYAAMFQQFPYTQVIGMHRFERKQPVCILIVVFQYLQCFLVQGYSDGLRLTLLRLLRHIL